MSEAARGFVGHVRELWGRRFWLPMIPMFYALVMGSLGFYRWEHVVVAGSCLFAAFYSKRSRDFLIDVAPYVLFVIGYDLVKYVIDATITPGRVITCGLRALELSWFSVAPGMTPQDYFTRHPVMALDLLFAVPYGVFFVVAFVYAGFLFVKDRPRMRFFLWSFATANFISFACWVIFPAAPPWYVRAHGCVADLTVAPSAAALVRVDGYIGIPYFQSFYARASQVFGALPSMHCAYPALGLLTSWRVTRWNTRWIHLLYTLTMFSASVYLDHHWIIDGLAGWTIAVVAVLLAKRMFVALGWPTSSVVATRPSNEKESRLAAAPDSQPPTASTA